MRALQGLTALFLLAMCGLASAAEDPACRNIDYSYTGHTAKELRAIAASCEQQDIAKLYYNRAYHSDLVEEARIKDNILTFSISDNSVLSSRQSSHDLEAYRLYIRFIEELAPIWFPKAEDRIAFLNAEYDYQGELAQLRLRGYEKIADNIERGHNKRAPKDTN